jgi:hypothetical protein
MSPVSLVCLVLVLAAKAAIAVWLYRQASQEKAEPVRWAALGLAVDVLAVLSWFAYRPLAVPASELPLPKEEASWRGR